MSFVDELLEALENSRAKTRAALEAERVELVARLAEIDRKLEASDQFDREMADAAAQGA